MYEHRKFNQKSNLLDKKIMLEHSQKIITRNNPLFDQNMKELQMKLK